MKLIHSNRKREPCGTWELEEVKAAIKAAATP